MSNYINVQRCKKIERNIKLKNYIKLILIMYQPIGFNDSENIIIINDIPYFRYTGSTYKDKLKNGLSLEYVFQIEDMIPIICEEPSIEIEENNSIKILEHINYEEFYEFYDQKEFEAISLARKGKWLIFKKRQARNKKKKNIKSSGYKDKLFAIEQELPNLFDESQIKINYDDISILSYESRYDDYDDYDYYNYYDYDKWIYN